MTDTQTALAIFVNVEIDKFSPASTRLAYWMEHSNASASFSWVSPRARRSSAIRLATRRTTSSGS